MERRFAVGDKVRVKAGLDVSKLRNVSPCFTTYMDMLIGTEMSVSGYWNDGPEAQGYWWLEDWLEPASTPTPATSVEGLTDDGIQTIRDAVTKAVATATPGNLLQAASALGLKVEQQTTYVLRGA